MNISTNPYRTERTDLAELLTTYTHALRNGDPCPGEVMYVSLVAAQPQADADD